MTCNTISLVSRLIWKRFRRKFIDVFEDVCSLHTCFSADSFHLLCCITPCESSGRFFRATRYKSLLIDWLIDWLINWHTVYHCRRPRPIRQKFHNRGEFYSCVGLLYNCGLTVRNKRICYVMLNEWMNEYLMEKTHRTRRAIRPLTLALYVIWTHTNKPHCMCSNRLHECYALQCGLTTRLDCVARDSIGLLRHQRWRHP